MDDERRLTPEVIQEVLDMPPSILEAMRYARQQTESEPKRRRLYHRDEAPEAAPAEDKK